MSAPADEHPPGVLRSAWQRFTRHMDPVVFPGAALTVVAFCTFGALYTEQAGRAFETAQVLIANRFGWYYVLIATLLLGFCLWLMCSRYGEVRLGPPDAEPDFSRGAWFAMLFSAGMGTGLVFWGVAEPLLHFAEPRAASTGTPAAAREALRLTFFHWGLHPWAIYIAIGLPIAYFHFRHQLPLAPRSILYPLIGARMNGWPGRLVDIVATVGTLLGVATSLGLGAMQINRGLAVYLDVPVNTQWQVGLIATITAVAVTSLVLGLDRGIRRLSVFNLALAGVMLAFVLVAGPTLFIAELFVTSLGSYLQHFLERTFWVALDPDDTWQSRWTLFYWGWWISWSPFVGIFAARISRGRTIREFIATVLLVPTAVTFAWLAVFGGTALEIELLGRGGLVEAVRGDIELSLHALLQRLPLAAITPALGTALIITFFVTSSDSGSWVDDMVTSGGNPNPPRIQRVFWGVSEGVAAMVLLLAGGLMALQNAAIASGLPMSLLLLLACYGLVKALRRDITVQGVPSRRHLRGETVADEAAE